jgi:hypothetical protein
LDFGATEALPHGWPVRLGPFLAAGRDGDAAALQSLATTAGLAPQDLPPAALTELLGPYFTPLRAPEFRFTRDWLREQTRRVSDPFAPAARIQRRLSVPPRHLLLLRVIAGLVGVLSSLGAAVAVDAEVGRWVPDYDTPTAGT